VLPQRDDADAVVEEQEEEEDELGEEQDEEEDEENGVPSAADRADPIAEHAMEAAPVASEDNPSSADSAPDCFGLGLALGGPGWGWLGGNEDAPDAAEYDDEDEDEEEAEEEEEEEAEAMTGMQVACVM
jgi:hypothetical protein